MCVPFHAPYLSLCCYIVCTRTYKRDRHKDTKSREGADDQSSEQKRSWPAKICRNCAAFMYWPQNVSYCNLPLTSHALTRTHTHGEIQYRPRCWNCHSIRNWQINTMNMCQSEIKKKFSELWNHLKSFDVPSSSLLLVSPQGAVSITALSFNHHVLNINVWNNSKCHVRLNL